MAVEARHFDVLVPHGTLSTAPLTTALAFPARLVDWVEINFPDGPIGLVGCRLASANTQIIPWNAGSWLLGNDRTFHFALANQITTGAWQLIAYNVGDYDHRLYIEFALSTVQQARTVVLPPPIDNAALSGETGLPN